MRFLELKIPPPIVALLVGLGMWGLSQWPPHWSLEPAIRYGLAGLIAAIAVASAVAGFSACRVARTTISPFSPNKTSSLVTTGIFQWTRNPMYLGVLMVLCALAVLLQSVWALLGPVLFFLWVHFLQILPEERILLKLFGESYQTNCSRVRRWI